MKILNRTEFMKLPENTLFSKYEPCVFGNLMIKGKTSEHNDFYVQQIHDGVDYSDTVNFREKLEGAEKNGTSIDMDFYCECRDGLFEDDQLFAVWEEKDVLELIGRLIDCVNDEMLHSWTEEIVISISRHLVKCLLGEGRKG
jgi:hypothetical protein